jgi:hypothetical protein
MKATEQDDELEEFFNSGVEKIEALDKQLKKDAEKKPVKKVEVSEDDRILYDLLGAYAGKRAAQAMDARVKNMPDPRVPPAPRIEPTMSPAPGAQPQGGMPRPVAGGPAGPVGGPASPLAQMGGQSLVPTDAMNTRQMQGTTVDGASGRARQNTYNENTAQQAASKRAQENVLTQLQRQGVVTQSADDILAKAPRMTSTASGIAIPASNVYPQAPATSAPPLSTPAVSAPPAPPKSGALSAALSGGKAVLNSPVVSGALGGLSMAESGQEFMKRRAEGDVPGQFMAGMGVAGGAAAMAPHPLAKILGGALSAASPLSLYLYDKIKNSQPPLPKPRIPAPGTNLPPTEFLPIPR